MARTNSASAKRVRAASEEGREPKANVRSIVDMRSSEWTANVVVSGDPILNTRQEREEVRWEGAKLKQARAEMAMQCVFQ